MRIFQDTFYACKRVSTHFLITTNKAKQKNFSTLLQTLLKRSRVKNIKRKETLL